MRWFWGVLLASLFVVAGVVYLYGPYLYPPARAAFDEQCQVALDFETGYTTRWVVGWPSHFECESNSGRIMNLGWSPWTSESNEEIR